MNSVRSSSKCRFGAFGICRRLYRFPAESLPDIKTPDFMIFLNAKSRVCRERRFVKRTRNGNAASLRPLTPPLRKQIQWRRPVEYTAFTGTQQKFGISFAATAFRGHRTSVSLLFGIIHCPRTLGLR